MKCPLPPFSIPRSCLWLDTPWSSLWDKYLCANNIFARWFQETPIAKWGQETGNGRKPVKFTIISRSMLRAAGTQSQWELRESVEGVEQGFSPRGSQGHGRGDFILSFSSLFAWRCFLVHQPMALLVVRGWNLESAFKWESQRFPVELCRHVLEGGAPKGVRVMDGATTGICYRRNGRIEHNW